MIFEIQSYIGAGFIRFGMSKKEVRNCFGNQFREYKKTPFDKFLTDDFGCCHVYYKNRDICEAIEFFDGVLEFNGVNLIGRPYAEINDLFKNLDKSMIYNDVGFISLQYGLGIYAPYAQEEPEEPIESVIVFEKGYYD